MNWTICRVLDDILKLSDENYGVEGALSGEGRLREISKLAFAAKLMAKRMNGKLWEYKSEYDASWWNDNPDTLDAVDRGRIDWGRNESAYWADLLHGDKR